MSKIVLPSDIHNNYEIYDYKNASIILKHAYPDEYSDLCDILRTFTFSQQDICSLGGNRSPIPKKFERLFKSKRWQDEITLNAKIIVSNDKSKCQERTIELGSHRVDFFKNRIALEIEWNSKDQTFDRDLYAFKAFFEYQEIDVGIIITRDTHSLNNIFNQLNILSKYGASTTHIEKLIPRIQSMKSAGCPILAIGITDKQYVR